MAVKSQIVMEQSSTGGGGLNMVGDRTKEPGHAFNSLKLPLSQAETCGHCGGGILS